MSLSVEIGWIVAVFLVSIRLGAVFVLTPLLGGFTIPVRLRVLIVLALSVALVTGAGIVPASLPSSTIALLTLAGRELVTGGLLAFALFVAFSAFLFAGRVLDMQIGFGIATLIDPITRSSAPLLGTALQLMAAMVFFAVDGHHVIIRLLATSFQHHAPGGPLSEIGAAQIAAHFGMIFQWGVALVAPTVFALLLLDVAMGLLSRTMPQMNVFIVTIPLKVLVGLVMLALTVSTIGPVIRGMLGATFEFWRYVLS